MALAVAALLAVPVALDLVPPASAQSSDTGRAGMGWGMGSGMGSAATAGDPAASTAVVEPAASNRRDIRASRMIGMSVRNPRGEDLGKIEDLVLDVSAGRVRYAVLSFGGVMGLGDKLFAYPVSSFAPAADRDELVLAVDRERLRQAPGYERGRNPNWDRYRADVDRFFGRDQAAASARRDEARDMATRRSDLRYASALIGKDVRDRAGADAGDIEDFVVRMNTGDVRFAVIDFDRAWTANDKLVPLPMTALRFPRDRDAVVTLSRERLDVARGFDEDRWPDLNDPAFRSDMDRYLASMGATGGTMAESRQSRAAAGERSGTPRAGSAG